MRKIIHIDMDCYYAAVEIRDFPEFKGKPLAVGGSRDRRGVISTCNYEARKFGVHSAMATAYALKLCPNLVLRPTRMDVYKAISQQIRKIYERYTHLIEPLSLDEAYLDVTDCNLHQGSATLIAKAIRSDIFAETGLTASAGIAPVKFLAKVASDLNKPNGQYVIPPHKVSEFVKTLPLKKIPGVGNVTYEKLKAMNLTTCGDAQKIALPVLINAFGKFGALLYERVQGIDNRQIEPNRERQSVSVETTLVNDIYSLTQCREMMTQLLPELNHRLNLSAKDRQINKLVVKLKFSDFKQTTVESRSTCVSEALFDNLLNQALERANERGIRLIGITAGLAAIENNDNAQQLGFQF